MGAIGFGQTALLFLLVLGSYVYADGNSDKNWSLGKKFVLLVAGSNGWENYKLQASVAHAYQVVRGNGIPANNIIVMTYDDVVNHTSNPAPGTLINRPNGPDVYKGIQIDYRGEDINTFVLLSVLLGNKENVKEVGSGRVIESGPLDNIFIYFAANGDDGFVYLIDDLLYADQLINTLNEMYIRRLYNKVVLYFAADLSGSMFDGILPEDSSILAVTATGPRGYSPACYCGRSSGLYKTCLGDEFSVNWMEDCNNTMADDSTSVFNQFQKVRTAVHHGDVMVYGDFKVGFEKLSSFIGHSANKINVEKSPIKYSPETFQSESFMSSRDIWEKSVHDELASTTDLHKQKHLKEKLHLHSKTKTLIDHILRTIYTMLTSEVPDLAAKIGKYENTAPLQLTMEAFPCYRNILNHISKECFSIPKNMYGYSKLTFLANICIVDNGLDKKVLKSVDTICASSKIPK